MQKHVVCKYLFSTLLLTAVCCNAVESKTTKISIIATLKIHDSFQNYLNTKSCRQAKIDFGSLPSLPARGLLDLIVLCKAMNESGRHFSLSFVEAYSYTRALRMLEHGEAHLVSESVWKSDINSALTALTTPVLNNGDFVKGIFTLPNHPLRKMRNPAANLHKFSAVSKENWKNDWIKLNEITQFVTNSSSYSSMFSMLKASRADFILLEFGTHLRSGKTINGILVKPVPGIKVTLPGSRHFAVSKKMQNYREILSIINSGLEKMRASGELKEAYALEGFHDERLKNWKAL